MYFWSNKSSLGEHKTHTHTQKKLTKILPTPNFLMVVYASNTVFNNKCTFAKMLLKANYRADKTEEIWGNKKIMVHRFVLFCPTITTKLQLLENILFACYQGSQKVSEYISEYI